MKKITLFLILSLTIMLAGCKKETATQGESEDTEVFPVEELTLDNSSDPVAVETTFKDPFVEGNFYYTIKNTDIYTSLEQAGIDEEELIMPYNTYGSQELWGEYGEISDYIDETGIVIDNHQLVVLEINCQTADYLGRFPQIISDGNTCHSLRSMRQKHIISGVTADYRGLISVQLWLD